MESLTIGSLKIEEVGRRSNPSMTQSLNETIVNS